MEQARHFIIRRVQTPFNLHLKCRTMIDGTVLACIRTQPADTKPQSPPQFLHWTTLFTYLHTLLSWSRQFLYWHSTFITPCKRTRPISGYQTMVPAISDGFSEQIGSANTLSVRSGTLAFLEKNWYFALTSICFKQYDWTIKLSPFRDAPLEKWMGRGLG